MNKEIFAYDEAYLEECLSRAFSSPEQYNVPMGVIRYDYETSHGWFLRVSRDKAMFREFFGDIAHGSIENALRSAMLRRHDILSSFPVTLTIPSKKQLQADPEERVKIKRSWYGKNKEKLYEAYMARWYDEDFKIQQEPFAFLKHGGKEQARKLAIEAATKNHNYKPKLVKIPDLHQKNEFTSYDRGEVEIFSKIDSGRPNYRKTKKDNHEAELNYDPHAFEGKENLVLHRQFERDRKLRKLKLEEFLKEHGNIHCELCHFRFSEHYLFLEADIIEVHHLMPLSKLKKEHKTHLSDLMLLCSNCHFAIHQGDEQKNLKEAQEHFEQLRKSTNANKSGDGQ